MVRLVWLGLMLMLMLSGCAGQLGDPVQGRQLYFETTLGSRQAPGCITCHSLEPGEEKVGPSHAEMGSRALARVQSPDYTGQAEDANGYLRESILDPDAYMVEGFEAGVMYQAYDEVLSEEEVDDLVAFLLSLQ
jgi:cytochrome c2